MYRNIPRVDCVCLMVLADWGVFRCLLVRVHTERETRAEGHNQGVSLVDASRAMMVRQLAMKGCTLEVS